MLPRGSPLPPSYSVQLLTIASNHKLLQETQESPDPMSLFAAYRFNLPWVAATGLVVWFLFVHTPPFLRQRHLPQADPLLTIHILTAATIYLSCAHNCLCTPGCGHLQRHTWVGRVGMLSGIVSFTLGAWITWTRLGKSTTLSFSIPITIGGILQLHAQYNGYVAIRKYKELDEGPERQAMLRKHIGNMIGLFLMACGIPAAIRLSETLAPNDSMALGVLVALIVTFQLLANRYMEILSVN